MDDKKKARSGDVLIHPYEVTSRRLHVLKFALVFILIAFLIGGMFVLRDQLTAENLRFLIRDIGFSSPSIGFDTSALSFDYDTSLHAGLYRGDLVLLRRSSLEITNFSGTRSLSQNVALSSPSLVTGDKYLLAYDIGGTHLGIYNSFSQVYTEDFPLKIACADLADDGTFAVVSAERGYHSALYVYNNNFKRIYRYATADRVIYDVSVCKENPALVAVCAVQAKDGDFLTEVLLFDTTLAEVQKTFSFPSEMPLELSFETAARITLLTDSALHSVDTTGEAHATHAFSSGSLTQFHSDTGYNVLVRNADIIGTGLTVDVVSDASPNETLTFTLQNRVQDICIADGNVYLLSHDSLAVYSLAEQTLKTHALEHEYKEILPLSGGRIAFIGEGSASIYMVN